MEKKSTIYWTCQIAGWCIYSIICFAFGLVLGGIYYTILIQAVVQFAIAGIISSHLMRVALSRIDILQKPLKIQVLYFFCITLCFSAVLVSVFYSIELIKGFYKIKMNPYSVFIVRTFIAFVSLLIWNLIYFAYQYAERARKEEKNIAAMQLEQIENERILAFMGQKAAELQKQKTELEMQALRAQMNPHFIFNCLSSINRFILKNEGEAASDYLTKFSRLIRMVLTNSKKELITLDDELEMLRLYLEMERMRFKYSFDYNVSFKNEIDPENIFIPPLLLQPFTENAIWHGLMNKEGRGHLSVLLSKENNILKCIVEDNGVGRVKAAELKSKSAEKKKSLGLQITKERLALLNGDSDEATFFEVEDLYDSRENAIGTRVILKIKFSERFEKPSLIS